MMKMLSRHGAGVGVALAAVVFSTVAVVQSAVAASRVTIANIGNVTSTWGMNRCYGFNAVGTSYPGSTKIDVVLIRGNTDNSSTYQSTRTVTTSPTGSFSTSTIYDDGLGSGLGGYETLRVKVYRDSDNLLLGQDTDDAIQQCFGGGGDF